jgi:AraC family transcriptional regulator
MEVDAVSLQRIQGAIAELLTAIETTLDEQHKEVLECLRRAGTILNQSAQPQPSRPAPPRGGLAPRQVRDVRTFIDTNLESPLTTKDMASAANLSTFYFCRAFRVSFNITPHAYVMRRRIERAQGLMLQTDTSLGQIAMDCGLADQPHFNRLFRRLVGDSPGAWRRARKMAPARPHGM